VRPPEIQQKQ